MGNRTIYIVIAVVIVLAIIGYAGGWFGSGTPVPTTTPAPATTTPAPATTAPAPATGTTTQ